MDDLKIYDVEFVSINGYSGRSICQAYGKEEAIELTKKALKMEGCDLNSGDMYDVMVLELELKPKVCLLGFVGI